MLNLCAEYMKIVPVCQMPIEMLPGAKVLDGRWGVEKYAIGIPKGRDQGAAFLRKFTEDVKAEGVVKAAITRAGLRGTAEDSK